MRSVRALERGLEVLSTLSMLGVANAAKLAEYTGIPRPTVYRLLLTLCAAGYVRRNATDDGFHLTFETKRLSSGFSDETWIRDIGGPLLYEMGRQLIWPCNLATLFDGMMVIRETTHPISPLSIDRGMLGSEWSMTRSSMGRVYLGFCPDDEFEELMRLLPQIDAKTRRAADEDRQKVAADGYAASYDNKIHGLAVPIRTSERVLGVLHVLWFRRALTLEVAVERFLPTLQQYAHRIEVALNEQVVAPIPAYLPDARKADEPSRA